MKEIEDLKRQRAALTPKAPDRTDLFGELQRSEVRTWLRSLDENTRRRVVLETDDPTIKNAVMFASAAMSGLTDEVKKLVVDCVIEQQFGSQLRELDAIEEGIDCVHAAIKVTEGVLAKLPGLSGVSEAA